MARATCVLHARRQNRKIGKKMLNATIINAENAATNSAYDAIHDSLKNVHTAPAKKLRCAMALLHQPYCMMRVCGNGRSAFKTAGTAVT